MDAATFLDNFGYLADAPNDVEKLREMMLRLALKGKLTTAYSSDLPAESLVESFQCDRKELISNKAIRNPRKMRREVSARDTLEYPDRWQCGFLGDLSHDITKGTTPTTYGYEFQTTGISFVKVENVKKGSIQKNTIKHFLTEDAYQFKKQSQLQVGDLLFSIAGTIGESCVVRPEDLPASTNQALAIIRGTIGVFDPHFLYLQLRAIVTGAISKRARGGAMNNVSLTDLREMFVLVPPLAEQKRIVAKVDELMALCDELETQQQARATVHVSLNNAALDRLTSAENDADFKSAWTRVRSNFDTLYSIPENVKALRQTILQLAVMGKLVEQDPNDEPASVLLERITEEKVGLEESGIIKKQPRTNVIQDCEVLFEIPKEWTWVRAAEISYPISSGSTPKKEFFQSESKSGVPYLKVYNIRDQEIDFDYRRQYVKADHHAKKMKRSTLVPGMVVLNIVGPPLGKTAVIPDSFPEWNCNQAIAFFRLLGNVLPNYIHTYFRAGTFLKNIALIGTAGQDNISVTKCKNIVIPLPPLAEQQRIVTRVNELMSLCDELEARLTQQQTDADHLTEAMIAGVLETQQPID